jgi:CBS domain containing-hemolysin-like protein
MLELQIDKVIFFTKIIIYTFFIILSGIFDGIETALLKYSAKRLKVKEKLLPYVSMWEKNPEVILGAILIGTNLACVGVGVLSESLGIWIGYSTILLLLIGELLPKIFALLNPLKFINLGIKKLFLFSKIVYPLSKFLVNISLYFTGLFLGNQQESPFLTADEVKDLIYQENDITKDEKIIYSNILEIADKRVYDVMIPKEEIVAVDGTLPLEEIIEELSSVKYSRIPVYKNNLDNIIGIVYMKDLILAMQNKEIIVLEDLLREPYFVIDTAKIIDVLKNFKQGKYHMAIVVDEYGSTVGLVTIEDIIEEIVGEIYDEYDIREEKIKFIDKNILIVSGDESIKNVAEVLGKKFDDEEVATIGGYVVTKLGYIPDIGQKIKINDLDIEILDATDKVIKKMKIILVHSS